MNRGCTEDFYKNKIFSNTFFSHTKLVDGVSYEISSRQISKIACSRRKISGENDGQLIGKENLG